jgi:hypothetical protein
MHEYTPSAKAYTVIIKYYQRNEVEFRAEEYVQRTIHCWRLFCEVGGGIGARHPGKGRLAHAGQLFGDHGVSSMTNITDKIGVISVGAAKAARPICCLLSPDSKAG